MSNTVDEFVIPKLSQKADSLAKLSRSTMTQINRAKKLIYRERRLCQTKMIAILLGLDFRIGVEKEKEREIERVLRR